MTVGVDVGVPATDWEALTLDMLSDRPIDEFGSACAIGRAGGFGGVTVGAPAMG
jgi:hypothetical protein